jgi:hypothetical protein
MAVSLIGNYLISIRRGAETLDAGRAVESSGLRKQVEDLTAAKKVSPWEQEQRRLVAEKMAQFTEEDQAVIRYALQHTSVHFMDTVNQFGDDGPSVMSRAVHAGLFHHAHNDHYVVNSAFLLALSYYFHGD